MAYGIYSSVEVISPLLGPKCASLCGGSLAHSEGETNRASGLITVCASMDKPAPRTVQVSGARCKRNDRVKSVAAVGVSNGRKHVRGVLAGPGFVLKVDLQISWQLSLHLDGATRKRQGAICRIVRWGKGIGRRRNMPAYTKDTVLGGKKISQTRCASACTFGEAMTGVAKAPPGHSMRRRRAFFFSS